jgi:hypothetical protein
MRNLERLSHQIQDLYFSASDLESSVRSGCGSCAVIHSILKEVFPLNNNNDDDTESALFNVSVDFTLKKKSKGETEAIIIQLFHPRGE